MLIGSNGCWIKHTERLLSEANKDKFVPASLCSELLIEEVLLRVHIVSEFDLLSLF